MHNNQVKTCINKERKNKYEALGNLNEEPEDEIETEYLIMEKSFIETAKSVLLKKKKKKRKQP